jgi:hypothetical protein
MHLDVLPEPSAATAEEKLLYWVEEGLDPSTSRQLPGFDIRDERFSRLRLGLSSTKRVGEVCATQVNMPRINQIMGYILSDHEIEAESQIEPFQ